jgi:hypothetical protein
MLLDGVLSLTTYAQTGSINSSGGENEAWGRERANYGNFTIDGGAIWDKGLTESEAIGAYNKQNGGEDLI